MTRQLSRLAYPNGDLAVDRYRRVYKLRKGTWTRLDYVFAADASMLDGKAKFARQEVAA